jgi:hypothetical protein
LQGRVIEDIVNLCRDRKCFVDFDLTMLQNRHFPKRVILKLPIAPKINGLQLVAPAFVCAGQKSGAHIRAEWQSKKCDVSHEGILLFGCDAFENACAQDMAPAAIVAGFDLRRWSTSAS